MTSKNPTRTLCVAAALLAIGGLANAHTHLKGSTPADKAILASSPQQISLRFSEPTRVTSLSIRKAGDKEEKKLTPLPTQSAAEVSVPVGALEQGEYIVTWRAVGSDNHVMSGKMQFAVRAK